MQHFMERVRTQDKQMSKLDEELLMWHKNFDVSLSPKKTNSVEHVETVTKKPPAAILKITKSAEVQTVEIAPDNRVGESDEAVQIASLKSELIKTREVVDEKERSINQLKSRVTELEMTISLFRKQIGDKQSQIMFYERHIMELQSKKDEVHSGGAGGDNISVGIESNKSNEEITALKVSWCIV